LSVSTAALVVVFSSMASAEASVSARRMKAAAQGAGVEPTAGIVTGQRLFNFRSGFWLNLHHFLYLQAVLATPEARKDLAETTEQNPEAAVRLSPEQKAIWDKALSFYAPYGKRDPLRDRELIKVNYELSDAGNSPSLAGRELPKGMQSVLEEAAPVYRALWWSFHDRKNREWAGAAARLIQEYGASMTKRIAAAYQTDWPKEPTTTEVVIYANWAGAYTTLDSTLITISSADPSDESYTALETLFHEASHALVGKLQERLDTQVRAAGKTATFQLTHAIIFFTAGTITSESLAKNNIHDYIPYAVKYGLYDRIGDWKHYKEVCDRDWLPYLDGKISFDLALTQVAKDF
jgi:hypothetical protein